MKKVLCIVVAVLLFVAFSTTAFATEYTKDEVPETNPGVRYTLIYYARIGFEINGSGLALMNATLQGMSGVDRVRISAYLQKYDGGWKTVQHYSDEEYSDFLVWGNTRYVVSGYTYRLRVYYYAYDGSQVESTYLTLYDTY